MEKLTGMTEQLKDPDLPLEQLAPLVEQALAQAAACEKLLGEADDKVSAEIRRYGDMLARLRLERYH